MDVVSFLSVVVIIALLLWAIQHRMFREGFSDTPDMVAGHLRLKHAVSRVRSKPADNTPDPWSEMFAQEHGGELFLQGDGRDFHSAFDVKVNPLNPYSRYVLEYDHWARRMAALALPAPLKFATGTHGVFCGEYRTPDGTRAFTVLCPCCVDSEPSSPACILENARGNCIHACS